MMSKGSIIEHTRLDKYMYIINVICKQEIVTCIMSACLHVYRIAHLLSYHGFTQIFSPSLTLFSRTCSYRRRCILRHASFTETSPLMFTNGHFQKVRLFVKVCRRLFVFYSNGKVIFDFSVIHSICKGRSNPFTTTATMTFAGRENPTSFKHRCCAVRCRRSWR